MVEVLEPRWRVLSSETKVMKLQENLYKGKNSPEGIIQQGYFPSISNHNL